MSSRGADLVVVSVQLKTGYLSVNGCAGESQDSETAQILKQVRGILYAPRWDLTSMHLKK